MKKLNIQKENSLRSDLHKLGKKSFINKHGQEIFDCVWSNIVNQFKNIKDYDMQMIFAEIWNLPVGSGADSSLGY